MPERVSFELPVFPSLNKHTIPALSALVLTAYFVRQPDQNWPVPAGWLPKSLAIRGLILVFAIGAFGTVATNGSTLVYGPTVLPRLKPYDALSLILAFSLTLIPFVLGRKVLASTQGQKYLLVALVVSATVYSFLSLYEVRMSPQINNFVYGFFPHSWVQHIRGDGFRPLVFLNHGLWLGIYFALATVAAAGLFRIDKSRLRSVWALLVLWLLGSLFLAKSLGALLIALSILPVVFFIPNRFQVLAAVSIAAMILLYPAIRSTNILPLDQLASVAAGINPDRARSLQTRLNNEDRLLAKAQEKPSFGWGGWGRSRNFDESGRDISTTDGSWIIIFGQGGWFRYISVFGLLTFGIMTLFWKRGVALQEASTVSALVLAAGLVDLIPNATMTPVTWLFAGALAGRLERMGVNREIPSVNSGDLQRSSNLELTRTSPQYARRGNEGQPTFRRATISNGQLTRSEILQEGKSILRVKKYRREMPERNRANDIKK